MLKKDLVDKVSSELSMQKQDVGLAVDIMLETMAKALADMLREQQALGRLNNPVGWMFSMLRRARSGELKISEDTATASSGGTISRPVESRTVPTANIPVQPAKRPSQGQVRAMIAAIRQQVQK